MNARESTFKLAHLPATAIALGSLLLVLGVLVLKGAASSRNLIAWCYKSPARESRLAVRPEYAPRSAIDGGTLVMLARLGCGFRVPEGTLDVHEDDVAASLAHDLGHIIVLRAANYKGHTDDIWRDFRQDVLEWPEQYGRVLQSEYERASVDYLAWITRVLESDGHIAKDGIESDETAGMALRARIKAVNSRLERGIRIVQSESAVLIYYRGSLISDKWTAEALIECVVPQSGMVQRIVLRSDNWESCDKLGEYLIMSYEWVGVSPDN